MSYNFKNVILLVVFNYSNCVCNKHLLKRIYAEHFKTIIFYSDIPNSTDEEINFIDIGQGYYTAKVFKHFYVKYKELINESDGLFYTMDDNIINVNILNLYKNDKILYYKLNSTNNHNYHTALSSWFRLDDINNHTGWWWNNLPNGKPSKENVIKLLGDDDFKQYNIDKFTGGFSDWFYLPKKYLTDHLFELFELFAKYDIFLEIAIPSVINNIENDETKYQLFTHDILWWNNRDNFSNKEYVYNSFNKNHNLIAHPIKFNSMPDCKEWVVDLFCKDKCVIITTINKPTEAIIKHINNPEYEVIIVGDNKTPDDYKNLNCIYLDIASQDKLFPELSNLIPYNHYCRKNLGYLYAVKKGYKIIYETDDDNIPYDNFDNVLQYDNLQMITEQNNVWINIFKYFTNNAHIWPRGYPLSLLKTTPNYLIQDTNVFPSIINGLVENDPDVDALFRIISNHENSIKWEPNKKVLIDNTNVCVFNTQNTFWVNPELFICLLIPSSVSFRYCDILRGIINNIVLNKTSNYMMYSSPNVVQNRNEHNLINDFKSEYEMYIHNEEILNFIGTNLENKTNVKELLLLIYNNLFVNNVIKESDIVLLNKWVEYF